MANGSRKLTENAAENICSSTRFSCPKSASKVEMVQTSAAPKKHSTPPPLPPLLPDNTCKNQDTVIEQSATLIEQSITLTEQSLYISLNTVHNCFWNKSSIYNDVHLQSLVH